MTYQGKVVNASKANKAINQILILELAAQRESPDVPTGARAPMRPRFDLRRESEDQRGRRQLKVIQRSQVRLPQRQPEPVVRVEHGLEPVDVHHG